MKSLFKVTLLATTMAVALNAPLSFAAETTAKAAPATDSKSAFKNDDQKSAYALGASLGRYMENSLKEQEKLGIKLDKDQLIAGVQDAFADKSKLSDQVTRSVNSVSEISMGTRIILFIKPPV